MMKLITKITMMLIMMKFNYPDGATPLEHDELTALIPTHISTQRELNAWEATNILDSLDWAFRQKEILTISFLQNLHKRMFDKTWKWAGQFRKSEKNIGVAWQKVPEMLKNLCDDVQYQIEHKTFSADEIAIRFHHRLVFIHPFSNGNGRHARLAANLLIKQLGQKQFTWGMNQDLTEESAVRKEYIQALQLADKGDYKKLITFARS